jgi:hypothetical protein
LPAKDDQRLGERVDAVAEPERRRIQVAQDAEAEQRVELHRRGDFPGFGIALDEAHQIEQLGLVWVAGLFLIPASVHRFGKLAVEILEVPLVAEDSVVESLDVAGKQPERAGTFPGGAHGG